MISLKLVGMDDINDNFQLLSAAMRDKVLKKAIRAAATPIRDSARSHCAVDLGHIRDSIEMVITSKGDKGNWVSAFIGPKTGIRQYSPVHKTGLGLPFHVDIPTRRAHLLEFGHRLVNRKGETIGNMPARPFMRPAWDSQGGETALNRFEETAAKEFDQEVSKLPDSAFIDV